MVILAAALISASLLFCLGLVRSHWVAPAALFAISGPVVAAFSFSSRYDVDQIATHLVINLSLFYAAFAFGHWVASSMEDRR